MTMGRFDRPEELGAHLAENAATWTELLGDLDARSIELFGRIDAVARQAAALRREILAPHGVNYAELITLGILHTTRPEPRRSPTELRALIVQTSAGMTRILDKLEAEELVRRDSSPSDGRRVDIVLAPRGRRLTETAFRALLGVQNRLLADVDERARRGTIRALDLLLAAFADRSELDDGGIA
jgi:DNA-binding MarR family transcriptional regulator